MLNKKDYLLRQIQELIEAIIRLFTSIQLEEKNYDPEYVDNLYKKYLQEKREFFIKNTPTDIIDFLSKNTSIENTYAKMEILSELLFGEGKILSDREMIKKAVEIQEIIIKKSKTFDFSKQQKLKEMKSFL